MRQPTLRAWNFDVGPRIERGVRRHRWTIMKYKTSELSGDLLDLAVSIAEGRARPRRVPASVLRNDGVWEPIYVIAEGPPFFPTTDWAHGGPIIERERITLRWREHNGMMETGYWAAMKDADSLQPVSAFWMVSPSPLVAAMLAFVAAKLGDEVEL